MKFINEYEKEENIRLISTEDAVSVSYKDGYKLSIVEISLIDKGEWYINRVLVKSERSKGLGSKLLQLALSDIIKKYNPNSIIVTPGGYNVDPKRQKKFYIKNGFIEDKKQPGLFFYEKLNKPK